MFTLVSDNTNVCLLGVIVLFNKISVKIIVLNTSLLLLALSIFYVVNFTEIKKSFKKKLVENLEKQTEILVKEYELLFQVSKNYTLSYRKFLEENITLEILRNDMHSKEVFEDFKNFGEPIVKELNLLDLYCWLAPEYVNNIYGLAIENFSLNRNPVSFNPQPYNRNSIQGESWQWFYGAEKNGTNITKPYDWDGIDGKVISYTEALIVEGNVVGVVGTDFLADSFEKKLLSTKILETGYFALADEKFNMLFHPSFPGKHISDVYSKSVEKDLDYIISENHRSGVFEVNETNKLQTISYRKLFNGWYLLGFPSTNELYEELSYLKKRFLIILFITCILMVLSTILFGVSISQPLAVVTKSLKEISDGDGDLTKEIKVKTKDETFLLANHFNEFTQNLKSIIMSIKKSSIKNSVIGGELNASSNHAADSSKQMTKSIEKISDQIKLLDSNINETTRGVYEINSNINLFKQQINDQVSAVEESSASVQEMIASLNNVSKITNKKLESTQKLVATTKFGEKVLIETNEQYKEGISDKIDNIRRMVDIISNLSRRTNLLAMNAAIEAAHAGDFGKGFAVVSDEIRKMAEEAAVSTTTISTEISLIVESITGTNISMRNTSEAFKSIYNEVMEIDVALNEIATNTIELSTGGHEILKAVSLLTDTSSGLSNGVNEIEIGSKSIKESMTKVKNVSNKVFGEVNEISNGVNEVTTSFQEVTKLADDLSNETKKLTREVNRFKVC